MSSKGSFFSNSPAIATATNPSGPAVAPDTPGNVAAPSSFFSTGGGSYAQADLPAVQAYKDEAAASEAAALASQNASAASATAAQTSASNAGASETLAATQASNASASATAAGTSAANALTSETNAAASATAAGSSQTAAASSASAAASSASAANTSASSAAGSATSASGSATAANTSAGNAASSASAASTSAASAASAADTEIANRAVRYDVAQTLTSGQKTQAQSNIGLSGVGITLSGHLVNLGGSLTLAPADVSLGNVTNDAQTKAAIMPNTLPTAGQLPVGNAGNTAYAPVALSGDGTLSSTGALSVTKTGGVLFGTAATKNVGTAAGTVAAGDDSRITGAAPLNSPGLTGVPTAPTAVADTNTTQLATTQWVNNQTSATLPVMDGTATAGLSGRWARSDHVHPTDTSRAPLSSIRTPLTANTTVYVATTGNDTTGTGTSGAPWATVQKAINYAGSIDLRTFNLTIQLSAGTYGGFTVTAPFVGSGTVTINGGATAASYVIDGGTADACYCANNGTVYLTNCQLQSSTAGSINCAIECTAGGTVYHSGVNFGNCQSGNHMYAWQGGRIIANGNYTIVGNAGRHWDAEFCGQIIANGRTITISGAITLTYWCVCTALGMTLCSSCTFTNSASVTATKYFLSSNGVIYSGGLTLPGTTAGSAGSGGQYI